MKPINVIMWPFILLQKAKFNCKLVYTSLPHVKPKHATGRKEAYLFCDVRGPVSLFSSESSELLLCTQGSFF